MDTQVRPTRRRDGLLVEDLPDETLVYDLERHRAHCLSRAARLVWERCDGRSTAAEIAAAVELEPGVPTDARVVRLALEQLGKARLLDGPLLLPEEPERTTRRALIAKLGLTAAAVPLVTSILAPTAAAGASVCSGTTSCGNKICPAGYKCVTFVGMCICRSS